MKARVNESVIRWEADNLQRLLRVHNVKNISQFAAGLVPKRTRADIHQHLHALRPIPLNAAKSYAAALNVSIREVSPRWAAELQETPGTSQPGRPIVDQLLILLEHIADEGVWELIGQAKLLQREYPLYATKKRFAPDRRQVCERRAYPANNHH